MTFISVDEARAHLRLPAGITDDDLTMKITQAEAIVLARIARPLDATWIAEIASWSAGSPAVAPDPVKAAMLLEVADLFFHRGDERTRVEGGSISPEADALLKATGYCDPVLS